jgi:hypothetical protein
MCCVSARYFAVQSTLLMTTRDQFNDLAHIRGLMDRSTRFLSLSGLSGVIAGIAAIMGALLAKEHYLALCWDDRIQRSALASSPIGTDRWNEHLSFLLVDGAVVLVVAISGALWFTWRRGRKTGQGIWDASARRLVVNTMVPLIAGGVFCLALFHYRLSGLVPATTLIFYGLALFHASKFTLDEIRWLGLSELLLGLVALVWLDSALLIWTIGFGVLHIVYGALMYFRYERGPTVGVLP